MIDGGQVPHTMRATRERGTVQTRWRSIYLRPHPPHALGNKDKGRSLLPCVLTPSAVPARPEKTGRWAWLSSVGPQPPHAWVRC
jgi:hypothetical protein